MAGRKKSVSVQEELLLCPSAKSGDWFPGIPLSAVAGIDEAGRGCLAGPIDKIRIILFKEIIISDFTFFTYFAPLEICAV